LMSLPSESQSLSANQISGCLIDCYVTVPGSQGGTAVVQGRGTDGPRKTQVIQSH